MVCQGKRKEEGCMRRREKGIIGYDEDGYIILYIIQYSMIIIGIKKGTISNRSFFNDEIYYSVE